MLRRMTYIKLVALCDRVRLFDIVFFSPLNFKLREDGTAEWKEPASFADCLMRFL